MASRLPALVPRLAILAVVALLATTGLTYAAEQGVVGTPSAAPASAQVPKPALLVVPDVEKQAFVFAKGTLQDAGFAWRVVGSVRGFPANLVAEQSPLPGTRVVDTGAPLVTVTLRKNARYKQNGEAEDSSPYRATPLRRADAAVSTLLVPPVFVPKVKTAVKPAAATHATHAAAKTHPAATKHVVAKKSTAGAKAAPKPRYPQVRPAAFAVAGAPKEPLDEMPLPDRARALGAWVARKPSPTAANVHHWLYQNAWVVTGAKFGWWRGAAALKILVDVDRRTVALWGFGARSEAVAASALSEVRARSR
jgi:hypothetical protein